MPISFEYNPRTFSDPSSLPEGLHPAYLIQVVDEETPAGWQMAQKSPRMWRFFFATWDNPSVVATTEPELQSQVCSQTFSAGGKYPASKAYLNMKACLNRDIPRGEKMDPNSIVPLPCQLYISRYDKNNTPIDFANVRDVKPWPQGVALLTPELKARLMAWWEKKSEGLAQPEPPAPEPPAPQMAVAQPAQQVLVPPTAQEKAGW